MASNETTTTDRTETKDHRRGVEDGIIEGDRIHKNLVARVPAMLGGPVNASPPDNPAPDTEVVAVTRTKKIGIEDTHRALLVHDPTGLILRATRLDRRSFWKVRDVGTEIKVTDGEVESCPDDEAERDEFKYMREWVNIVIGDRVAGHYAAYDDEIWEEGSTLCLRDTDCRKGYADYELVNDE